jgi:GT2 family glycosyltransferase
VIASPVNTGFAGGNNLALRTVRTPYAVLLNNDAVPEPDWLRNLLAPFEEDGATGSAWSPARSCSRPGSCRCGCAPRASTPARTTRASSACGWSRSRWTAGT